MNSLSKVSVINQENPIILRRRSPVGQRGAAVVGGDPVLSWMALHYYVFPKFLPDQRAGHSA